jgi:hypothetical protein
MLLPAFPALMGASAGRNLCRIAVSTKKAEGFPAGTGAAFGELFRQTQCILPHLETEARLQNDRA